MNFKPPKSDIQEVLYLLLTEGYVSCISASYMHGFRTRVSELRRKHKLVLDAKEMHSVNRNGNLFTYHEHRLALCSIKKATELYHKMTGNIEIQEEFDLFENNVIISTNTNEETKIILNNELKKRFKETIYGNK